MNAFEKLGLDVKLDISEEEIRKVFRKMAAGSHPDAGGDGDGFAKLTEAQEILLSPARRLKEWLLVRGMEVNSRGVIDASLMDLFQRVAETGNSAEAAIKLAAGAQSTLAKAMAEVKLMGERERVKALLGEIADGIAGRIGEFSRIKAGVADAGQVLRDLIFLEKWRTAMKSVYGRLM